MADCEPQSTNTTPFEIRDTWTDVTLVVEDKSLYFSKALLVISSPVFARMFNADFKGEGVSDDRTSWKELHGFRDLSDATAPSSLLGSAVR